MNQRKAKTSYKYDFIFSLTLLQIQRNQQHFKVVKLLAIHTSIRLREPLPDILPLSYL